MYFVQLCRFLAYILAQVTIRTISYIAIGTLAYYYVHFNDNVRINVMAIIIASSYKRIAT